MARPRAAEIFQNSTNDPIQSTAYPWGAKSLPTAACMLRFRSISAERAGVPLNTPLRIRPGRADDPRTADIFQGFLKMIRNWPLIIEVRNSALSMWRSRWISADLAGIPLNLADPLHYQPDGGPAGRACGRALRIGPAAEASLVVVALLRHGVLAAPWVGWFR